MRGFGCALAGFKKQSDGDVRFFPRWSPDGQQLAYSRFKIVDPQTGARAGTPSWADALEPYVAERWRLAELTVSYRTPAEIMAVAAEVLAEIDPTLRPPRSVRSSGVPPWAGTAGSTNRRPGRRWCPTR